MKRIALQLLLSFALILQGVSAFGAGFAHPACCCHGAQAAHGHCHHGHGTPCQPDCSHHCLGCVTSACVVVPAFATIAADVSAAVAPFMHVTARMRDDLPPTRPPIV